MDLPVLDPKVSHSNGGTAVAVPLADDLEAHSVGNALLISPCFA